MAAVFVEILGSVEVFSHDSRQQVRFQDFLGRPDGFVAITQRRFGDAFRVSNEVRAVKFQQQFILFVDPAVACFEMVDDGNFELDQIDTFNFH